MKMNGIVVGMISVLMLTACGDKNEPAPGSAAIPQLRANGGGSTSGSGGGGGYVQVQSYGAVKVLKAGTVDAVFTVPTFTPNFGGVHAVVSGGTTTVLLDADDTDGNICNALWDNNLYIGNGDGTCDNSDILVTGLTVTAGATLVLADQGSGYATLRLPNDLVIAGTLTADVNAIWGIDLEAANIVVESGGKIAVSAAAVDGNAGEIWLGNGNGSTKQIINRGTIEAKGLGSGSGGYMYFEPDNLVLNTGTIDASGGDSTVAGSAGGFGGGSGALDVFVDYGDFYSSGTVRVNGGRGATDGGDNEADICNISYNCNSVYVETAYIDNALGRNGDIIISGVWEANGGDGMNGRGGVGGYVYLQTNAMGTVMIDAGMSVRGGSSAAASFPGGSTYGIDIYSYNGRTDPATAGTIGIAGTYDLRGGNGDENGGNGGFLGIYSNGYTGSNVGSDVELVGFKTIDLNGGDGASGGGSASSNAFRLITYSAGAAAPSGPITNEARIEARGGRTSGAGSTGGTGGYVEMLTSEPSDSATVISNSGDIDISGGAGDTGGAAYGGGFGDALHLQAVHVTNFGSLTANGGNGVTAGGNGGNITLTSTDTTTPTPTTNSGALSVAGGTGAAAGVPGTRTIDGTIL